MERRGQRLLDAATPSRPGRARPRSAAARPTPTSRRSPTRPPASPCTTRRPTRVSPAGRSTAARARRRRSSPASTRWAGSTRATPREYTWQNPGGLNDVTSGSNGSLLTVRVVHGRSRLGRPDRPRHAERRRLLLILCPAEATAVAGCTGPVRPAVTRGAADGHARQARACTSATPCDRAVAAGVRVVRCEPPAAVRGAHGPLEHEPIGQRAERRQHHVPGRIRAPCRTMTASPSRSVGTIDGPGHPHPLPRKQHAPPRRLNAALRVGQDTRE